MLRGFSKQTQARADLCSLCSNHFRASALRKVPARKLNFPKETESLSSSVILYSSISQFYTEVTEVETWIREKLPRVSSEDYGRDETSAQSLLRKHETLELELDSYRAKVEDLRNTCQDLVKADNFDAERIQRRQVIYNFVFQI